MDGWKRLDALITSLYASPGSPEAWQSFLDELCAAVDGVGATFIAHDLASQQASIAVTARTDPRAIQEYVAQWSGQDPWAYSPESRVLQAGRVVIGEELISRARFRRTAFYNDFSRRYDIAQCLAGMIEAGPHAMSVVSINAGDGRGAFGESDAALLRSLMPHLQRALHLHRRLATAEHAARRSMEAFHRLGHGLIVLDAGGRVVSANRLAAEMVRERDGIAVDNGELEAASPSDTQALRRVVAHAIALSRGDGSAAKPGAALALGRPSGRRPLCVIVAPVFAKAPLLEDLRQGAMVFVTDPARPACPTEDQIRSLFGLTPAEAKLARALAHGLTLEQAARDQGLTLGTVRTRLKGIFEKTQTHRQTELVRLLLAGGIG